MQIIENGNVQEEYESMLNCHYNTENGLMWKARLIPCSDVTTTHFPDKTKIFPNDCDYSSYRGQSDANTENSGNISSVENNFVPHKYRYHLVMGYHHLISDGFTCMKIFSLLMKIFNNILSGKLLDEKFEIVSIVDTREESLLKKEIENHFKDNSALFQVEQNQYANIFKNRTNFQDAYPQKDPGTWRTSNLHISSS